MKNVFAILTVAAALIPAGTALAAPHQGSAFIRDYDHNGDGQVMRAEYDAARNARFKATDTNNDGWVSEDEYFAEYVVRMEKQIATSTESAEKKLEERQRQIRQTHVRFGALDTDKDAKMTKAEYDASGTRAFIGHDDDKDGSVTQADAAATTAKRLAARAKANP